MDVAGARPSMPQGNRRYLPEATGRPPGEELPHTGEDACDSVPAFFEDTSWISCTQVRIRMAGNDCKVCKESVTARCSGVVCELCELWVHTACVGLKASTKMLSHKNIMFLCDECLEAAKERMKASKEEKGTQTTATEICEDTKALSKVNKAEVQDMGMQTENEKDRHPRRGPAVKKNDQEEVPNLYCWGQYDEKYRSPPPD